MDFRSLRSSDTFKVPVLLIGYKRVSTMLRVIESLRAVRPKSLYFAANAPNPLNPDERAMCTAVRKLVEQIDWNCEIATLFRSTHLSAKDSISQAIGWFFEQVDQGIILEDDCVCEPSFFPFCQQLLDRYSDEPTVMHIGATNFRGGSRSGGASYFFSRYAYVWGWATWRRAWRNFTLDLEEIPEPELRQILYERFKRKRDQDYWRILYRYLKSGNLDTWDGQWNIAVFRRRGLCVVPSVNLVRNIGFGPESTNTGNRDNIFAEMPASALSLPLKHANAISTCAAEDDWVADNVFGVSKASRTLHLKMRIATRISLDQKTTIKRLLRW